jgi:hypothetical protein
MLGGDAAFDDAGAFGFQEAALEAGKRLADDDTSARSDDAVPGDGLTARAGGHGSAGGTSTSREAHGAGQLAVGGDAAFGDALDEGVESLPGSVHADQDICNGRELPDTHVANAQGWGTGSRSTRKSPGPRKCGAPWATRNWSPVANKFKEASSQFWEFRRQNRQKNSQ